jgi:hypothetical protein
VKKITRQTGARTVKEGVLRLIVGAKAQVHVAVTQTDNSGSGTAGYGYVPMAFMADSSSKWWIDTGATRHICADRSYFFSLQTAAGGSVLMGNCNTLIFIRI